MIARDELKILRRVLMNQYLLYKKGLISEQEYCTRSKPIDQAIDKIEMAILLQDTLAYEIPSLKHLH